MAWMATVATFPCTQDAIPATTIAYWPLEEAMCRATTPGISGRVRYVGISIDVPQFTTIAPPQQANTRDAIFVV